VKDGKADHITREPEQVKAFRDTWRDGIHSYLTYLRDRLTVARDHLTDSGSIFVQIGDENVHRVRAVMDEVFGDENCVCEIVLKTTSGAGSPTGGTITLAGVHDYVLWFAKRKESAKYRQLYFDKSDMQTADLYRRVIFLSGEDRNATSDELNDCQTARVFSVPITSRAKAPQKVLHSKCHIGVWK
jgi:adenine-specific DNA-methyltransferase